MVTEGFSRREFARIRGLLRGVTRPATLTSLAQRIKIDEFKLKATIDELVKSGNIGGKILKGLFVPTSFQKLQRRTILSQIKQNGYVEDALFSQLHINLDADKFMQQELAEEVQKPVKFSSFILSDTLFNSLEDQINQVCQDDSYINLVEILPDCFKKTSHTHELLGMLEVEARLMTDESHLCSVGFLNKCLARFDKRSE